MTRSINDLRGHLFNVLESIKDADKTDFVDTENAEVICLIAKRLIETAETEVKYLKLLQNDKTGKIPFLETSEERVIKMAEIEDNSE